MNMIELWKEKHKYYNNLCRWFNMNDNNTNNEEQEYIEELVKLGKKISIEAANDKNLQDKIKKLSSY